jgi:hypothetical protein
MDPGIIYAVLTIIFGLIAAGITHIIVRWLKKKASGTESQLDDILLAALGKPLVITILAGSIYIALTHFGILPESIAGFAVDQYVNAFFILIGASIVISFSYNLLRTYGSVIAEQCHTRNETITRNPMRIVRNHATRIVTCRDWAWAKSSLGPIWRNMTPIMLPAIRPTTF